MKWIDAFETDADQHREIEFSAMRLLSQREHTVRQLRRKLLARDYSAEDVDAVLQDLESQNLLSDTRFAEQYLASRMNKGYGPVRIRQELREKGVAEEVIEPQMEAVADLWQDVMIKSLYKKFGNTAVLNYSDRARRARFLEYRGFPLSMIRQQLFNQDL